MSLIFATQLTAVATAALAVFGIVTAWYRERPSANPHKRASDQAQMLGVQSRQLELQSQQLIDQREINALQAEDLRESLKQFVPSNSRVSPNHRRPSGLRRE